MSYSRTCAKCAVLFEVQSWEAANEPGGLCQPCYQLATRLANFKAADLIRDQKIIALRTLSESMFPQGAVVKVNCLGRFNGQAIVSGQSTNPAELPCRLENNNVWWYPMETIHRVASMRQWEPWIRRAKLPHPSMLITSGRLSQRRLP